MYKRQAWELVRDLVGSGRTVLLTTHLMDEARALADRLAVIVDGVIVAQGTPDEVVGDRTQGSTVRFRVDAHGPGLPDGLAATARRGAGGLIEITMTEPTATLHALTGWALGSGIELADLALSPPSLEDAYLALVTERTGPGS